MSVAADAQRQCTQPLQKLATLIKNGKENLAGDPTLKTYIIYQVYIKVKYDTYFLFSHLTTLNLQKN